VTGSAGFVGSHVREALLARGDRVDGVDAFTDSYDPAIKRANAASLARNEGFRGVRARPRRAPANPVSGGRETRDTLHQPDAQPC
jgi:nucleoside-diphosphate-sugar epimerase